LSSARMGRHSAKFSIFLKRKYFAVCHDTRQRFRYFLLKKFLCREPSYDKDVDFFLKKIFAECYGHCTR
jgi:hypothetical protein